MAGEATFILGGGPSLRQVDVVRLRGRGRVVAVNNAYLVAPWADVHFWADRRWFDWNHADLGRFEGKHRITRVAPHIETGLPIRVLSHDKAAALSRDPRRLAGICGGANAINLAALLGARVIVLLGFDMRPGNWHDLHRLPPKPGQHRDKFIPALERMAPELKRDGVLVLNATPGSALGAFPPADLEELLAMDDLSRAEQEKYEAIWAREEYRRVSPGMDEAAAAWKVMKPKKGERLIDFGAGPGRATAWFQEKGLEVLAVDFAENALETEVPFLEASLWELPATLEPAEHAYCCDVMEHIPTQKVGEVLTGIAACTRKSAFFRIATRPDRMGRLIGEVLHLTVRSGAWWQGRLAMHFGSVEPLSIDGRNAVFLCRPR